MNNELCKMMDCEFPLFAFSHCRDVVAAVSSAGGFGVLGGSGFTPESLEIELAWIDEHVNGMPYGVDILIPENLAVAQDITSKQLAGMIPEEHCRFIVALLKQHGIDATVDDLLNADNRLLTLTRDVGEQLMDVAFKHPIRLIANALGIAPASMIERGRAKGVPVGALVGAKEHAVRQINAGVDFIVAQGAEAGGHCGEVSTLVLVPEVINAVNALRPVPVLAAGGIMTGNQMAACMAMGAQGAWTGSIWLATIKSEATQVFREKMVNASSRDTIRSAARTGKPSRQLRSAWHDAWHGANSPRALSMPMMGLLSQPAFGKIDKAAEAGNKSARELVSYFVGQGVGLVNSVSSAAQVVQDFKVEFADAMQAMNSLVDD